MRCGLESPLQWLRQISDFHCVVRCSAFVPHITYFSGYSSPTRQPCITHSLTHSQSRQPTVCQNACTEVRAHAKHNISSCRKSAKGKHDWKKNVLEMPLVHNCEHEWYRCREFSLPPSHIIWQRLSQRLMTTTQHRRGSILVPATKVNKPNTSIE